MQTCGCWNKREKAFKEAHVWEDQLQAVQSVVLAQPLDVINLCNISQQLFSLSRTCLALQGAAG